SGWLARPRGTDLRLSARLAKAHGALFTAPCPGRCISRWLLKYSIKRFARAINGKSVFDAAPTSGPPSRTRRLSPFRRPAGGTVLRMLPWNLSPKEAWPLSHKDMERKVARRTSLQL